MAKRINVMVLMGGASSEHDVSMVSGQQVVKNLSEDKFNVFPVVISRDGNKWLPVAKQNLLAPISIIKSNKKELSLVTNADQDGLEKLRNKSVDIVFIAMHGPFGEDGKVQGMLDLMGIKYTGSGVLASALGMDKLMFRKLMASGRILTPKFISVDKNYDPKIIKKVLGNLPYFVKPSDQGSSVGMSIVNKPTQLRRAIELALRYSKFVLIDEYVQGREFTCAVLGNNKLTVLPVVEIIPKKAKFFDYKSKYSDGGADEIVPARITKDFKERIQKTAIEVYKLVGCKGFGRVDFILKDNSLYVLEINTIPGLTTTSLLPKAAEAAGITYPKLIEKIIKLGLE